MRIDHSFQRFAALVAILSFFTALASDVLRSNDEYSSGYVDNGHSHLSQLSVQKPNE